jgi:hypothetical protein
MEKCQLDKLTAALAGAGFEVVSLKEETHRHLYLEKGIGAFSSGQGAYKPDNDPTGIVLLEIKELW